MNIIREDNIWQPQKSYEQNIKSEIDLLKVIKFKL